MTAPDRSPEVVVRPDGEPSLAAETAAITVEGPFDVILRGGEAPGRVHCRLGETLGRVATLERANYYVEPDEEVPVEIAVDRVTERVTGTLELTAGYGSESIELSVTVEPDRGPEVDGTLAEPHREDPGPTAIDRLAAAVGADPATLGVVALGVLALAIAALTAAVVGGTAAFLGLLVVVAGIAVAAALLVDVT